MNCKREKNKAKALKYQIISNIIFFTAFLSAQAVPAYLGIFLHFQRPAASAFHTVFRVLAPLCDCDCHRRCGCH